jgi:hypothetical protein
MLLTTFMNSGPLAKFTDRKLPPWMETFLLFGSLSESPIPVLGRQTTSYTTSYTTRRSLKVTSHLHVRQQNVEIKIQHITGYKDPEEEWKYISTLSLTSALDGGGWLAPRPGRFTPETRYPLCKKLGGSQCRSGQKLRISTSPGVDPRLVEPVASRYTDWAIPVPSVSRSDKLKDAWGCVSTLPHIFMTCTK